MELPHCYIICFTLFSIIYANTEFKNLEKKLKGKIVGSVYLKGSTGYNERRIVHNALCEDIFPDLIVVPKSTEDVSEIVKITNEFNVNISVRSGGHSYTCTSIRKGKEKVRLEANCF